MIIIGIDPGIQYTGWGVIRKRGSLSGTEYIASGRVATNNKFPLPERLAHIGEELERILDIYRPELAALEETFVNKNSLSSLKLAHARGAIMLTVARNKIPLQEFAPNKVKKTVVGSGHANKDQISYMIKLLMPQAKPQNADEADALAIAYCCMMNL